jgi:hypothetical protein
MKRVVPIAERLLEQHGSFVPYGGALSREDEVILAGGKSEEDYSSSSEVIETVIEQLQQYAGDGDHKALAMVLDVRMTPPGKTEESDAIRVVLEHESGESLEAFIPYSTSDEGKIEYGELFAFPGKPRFFKREEAE